MKQEISMRTFITFLAVVGLILFSRWIPHPANFTALISMAIFAGSFWANKSLRFIAPLFAMIISDIVFGFYPGIEVNYLAVAMCVLLAPKLQAPLFTILGRSALASVVFFMVSNLGVWIFSGLYPQSFEGLKNCYLMAVPFYPALLSSALFYSALCFATYRLTTSEKGFEGFLKAKYG
jgi:hypothetical protein